MELKSKSIKFLFVVNSGAGNKTTDWNTIITNFFQPLPHEFEILMLTPNYPPEELTSKINTIRPQRVIAVGGDGTARLVAGCILESEYIFGIIPAGSANGMAKELGIPLEPAAALEAMLGDEIVKMHVIKVNNQVCIHLCDIGFNAFVVKKFESENVRGWWGYTKAAWKVLWQHHKMELIIKAGENYINRTASMIVMANATSYGSKALINPVGKIDDDLFEVVIIKKISLTEIFKMMVTHKPFNPHKTELIQTRSLRIQSKRKVHFQIDGEYQGKLHKISAQIFPEVLNIIAVKKSQQ